MKGHHVAKSKKLPQRHPELQQLDTYRLDRNFSWQDLGAELTRRGCDVSYRTLHYLIKRAPEETLVRDRTLHQVRKFMALVHEEEEHRTGPDRRKPAAQAQA